MKFYKLTESDLNEMYSKAKFVGDKRTCEMYVQQVMYSAPCFCETNTKVSEEDIVHQVTLEVLNNVLVIDTKPYVKEEGVTEINSSRLRGFGNLMSDLIRQSEWFIDTQISSTSDRKVWLKVFEHIKGFNTKVNLTYLVGQGDFECTVLAIQLLKWAGKDNATIMSDLLQTLTTDVYQQFGTKDENTLEFDTFFNRMRRLKRSASRNLLYDYFDNSVTEFTVDCNLRINNNYAVTQQEDASICDVCGDFCMDYSVVDKRVICNHCLDANTFTCYLTGELHYSSNGSIARVTNKYIGEDTEWNKVLIYRGDVNALESKGFVYVNDDHYTCFFPKKYCVNICGRWHLEYHKDYYNRLFIGNYHYVDKFDLLGSGTKKYTFGFELEMESKDSYLDEDEVEEVLNDVAKSTTTGIDGLRKVFVFEHDGSLDSGVEVISQPMTWGYWNNHMKDVVADFTKQASAYFKSHDTSTCGLHVHIGRDCLATTKRDQDTVVSNLAYLMEKFRTELVIFSRRKASALSRWASFILDDNSAVVYEDVKRRKENRGRYMALNLTNRKTVEIRIFKGTLNSNTINATMDLVHALVCMAKYAKNIEKVSFEDILAKCEENTKKYYKARAEIALNYDNE